MPKAIWEDTVIAESDETVVVENNHYFPPYSLRMEHFRPSTHSSICGWKGTASYYDVVVGDKVNANAAWYYTEPKDAAKEIAGHVAFWKGIRIR
jgi:uncharacterized protein (DUF427 family)